MWSSTVSSVQWIGLTGVKKGWQLLGPGKKVTITETVDSDYDDDEKYKTKKTIMRILHLLY